jgi:hypothetical protein
VCFELTAARGVNRRLPDARVGPAGVIGVVRDAHGDGLHLLARLLRRRFGPNAPRAFVVLAADIRAIRTNDQETQRIPVLR